MRKKRMRYDPVENFIELEKNEKPEDNPY